VCASSKRDREREGEGSSTTRRRGENKSKRKKKKDNNPLAFLCGRNVRQRRCAKIPNAIDHWG
jgi:hypothetical protein